jgi:NitT/TauT family transport system substrate-binding protein
MLRRNLLAACAAVAALAALAGSSLAAPVVATTTAAADGAPMFVAKEEGFYAKHGIDVQPTLTAIMPNIPPAILSGSVQIGLVTTTTFLQAVDGGLDLVALVGGSIVSRKLDNMGLMAREGSTIKTAQDLVGKKVGVPGIGAFLHVMFRYWLTVKGVDPDKVNYVEVTFPTMRDILAGGSVDAVLAIDPVKTQIVETKAGYVVSPLIPDLPDGQSEIIYISTRDWADAHPKEVAAFRAAIAEAQKFTNANPQKALEDFSVYVKMPAPVLKMTKIGIQDPKLTKEQLDWWVGLMSKQGLLKASLDTSKLIAK